MENHKTQRSYNNSVFIKRFIFEFTDFQLYLFYIGIYQLDIKMLRVNLISVFMVDEIRRILVEAVIPYLTQNKDEISKEVQAKIKKAKFEKFVCKLCDWFFVREYESSFPQSDRWLELLEYSFEVEGDIQERKFERHGDRVNPLIAVNKVNINEEHKKVLGAKFTPIKFTCTTARKSINGSFAKSLPADIKLLETNYIMESIVSQVVSIGSHLFTDPIGYTSGTSTWP